MHIKANTDWKRDWQAILPVCSAGARLLGSDCVLCPHKSVPGSAKCRQFKLKDSEQWLNKGGSLIVWVSDCEGDSEQVETGSQQGGESVRRSGHTEQLVSVERGSARLDWHPLHRGHCNFCPRSAMSQGRWFGVVKTAWQTLMWCETSLQSSQGRNLGDKSAEEVNCYFILYVWTSLR